MTNEKTTLLKIVNSSGFAFQLGVKHEIEKNAADHGWIVLVEEHRWEHPESSDGGYIDLVLKHVEKVIVRLVVECKKVNEPNWIFLRPETYPSEHRIASAFWTSRGEEDRDVWGWADVDLQPSTAESAFCVVKGQGKNPMLEHVADSLLPAVEAVGIQEMELCPFHQIETQSIHIPVIVTNARLMVCRFSPEDMDLESGELGDGEFEEVPFVRFRKPLGTQIRATKNPRDLKQANELEQCTILVINASSMVDVLSKLAFERNIGFRLSRLIEEERFRKYGHHDKKGSPK